MRNLNGYGVLALVVVVATGPGPALAQSGQSPDPCDALGGYQLETCLTKELAAADAALNAAYGQAEAAIAGAPGMTAEQKTGWKADLLAAQRAWLAFRDANCTFDLIGAEWSFGSGATSAQQHCVLTLTRTRAQELLDRYPPS
ncbi:lysozyme inhibitor LprI family protein [Hansschlegelia sp. KR7-227]|uniref:lysozyme inhibitor LprI family protein n=1 Tax=Hansschlegelia sp. KR7-227 TaxID=3400914 RepID=UPI003BFD5E42